MLREEATVLTGMLIGLSAIDFRWGAHVRSLHSLNEAASGKSAGSLQRPLQSRSSRSAPVSINRSAA